MDWLDVFDKDNLKLFLTELINLTEPSYEYMTGQEMIQDAVDNQKDCRLLVKEWYKTYLAAASEDHNAAYNDVTDDVELTKPTLCN